MKQNCLFGTTHKFIQLAFCTLVNISTIAIIDYVYTNKPKKGGTLANFLIYMHNPFRM
jgi:hypothetical protein